VHVAPPAEGAFTVGDFVAVRLTRAAPHWLHGSYVGPVRAARRRRVRIPVSVAPA
jgi:hypothetical protein